MLEGGLVFSLNSLVAGVLCVALGIYVFRKNPHLKGSQVFIVLMSFASLNGIAEFLMINAQDQGTAHIFSRMVLFLSICAGASLLYLACRLPYDRADPWPVRHKRPYAAISLACASALAVMPSSVSLDRYGWWTAVDAAFYTWLAMALAFCIGAVAVVLTGYRRERDGRLRGQYRILLVGVAILPTYGAIEVILNIMEIGRPPIFSIAVLTTGAVFAIALFRHDLFAIEPVREDGFKGSGAPSLAAGRCVLVIGKKGCAAYRMVVDDLASGERGMLISRFRSERVKEMFGLTKTPVIWLSTRPGPDRIDPAALSVLQHTIVDFLRKGDGSVVLLDGLEYLLIYNRAESVLRLIYDVKDAAVVSGSKFIVPVDPLALEARNLAFLERELEVVRPESTLASTGEDA